MQPHLYIIGGPNGAGKTTFAKDYLPGELNCLRFHNSDEIAMGISPFDASLAQMQAGRILLQNLKTSLRNQEDFVLESTLSGLTYLKYLRRAKELGYKLTLHFLWLPSAEESWRRVETRVSEGGHAVPKDAVFRRYPRIMENVIQHYASLMDTWYVWDASTTPASFRCQGSDSSIHTYLSQSADPRPNPDDLSDEVKAAITAMNRAAEKMIRRKIALGHDLITSENGKMVIKDPAEYLRDNPHLFTAKP